MNTGTIGRACQISIIVLFVINAVLGAEDSSLDVRLAIQEERDGHRRVMEELYTSYKPTKKEQVFARKIREILSNGVVRVEMYEQNWDEIVVWGQNGDQTKCDSYLVPLSAGMDLGTNSLPLGDVNESLLNLMPSVAFALCGCGQQTVTNYVLFTTNNLCLATRLIDNNDGFGTAVAICPNLFGTEQEWFIKSSYSGTETIVVKCPSYSQRIQELAQEKEIWDSKLKRARKKRCHGSIESLSFE